MGALQIQKVVSHFSENAYIGSEEVWIWIEAQLNTLKDWQAIHHYVRTYDT